MNSVSDSEFLNWVADRLVHRLGDPPDTDFVLRLRRMASPTADMDELIHGESFVDQDGQRIDPSVVILGS